MVVTALDWLMLGVLFFSMVLGAWRGLVYEVLSVLGWAAAFYLAQWFAPAVADLLPLKSASAPVLHAVAFVLLFIGVVFAAGLVSSLLKRAVQAIGLRPVDRTLGAAFGVVRGVILLLVAAVVIDLTTLKSSTWWQESTGAAVLAATLKGLKPMLPEQFARYMN